jgi:hypothetical protein
MSRYKEGKNSDSGKAYLFCFPLSLMIYLGGRKITLMLQLYLFLGQLSPNGNY